MVTVIGVNGYTDMPCAKAQPSAVRISRQDRPRLTLKALKGHSRSSGQKFTLSLNN